MENENTKILKELETNSEMGLVQGAKMIEAVDGLEPVMEGILLKTNELVEETKNSKSQVVIHVEGDVESIKGEKGDTPEVDYDNINEKVADMHKASMETMQKELANKVREDVLAVAEAIEPKLLDSVEEKMNEFGEVLLTDIRNVGKNVAQAETQIGETNTNLKKLEERVDDIKIPTYDFSPYAKTTEVTKEVSDVKKVIDEKVATTAKAIETLKADVEKKVEDLEDEQMQRLQKVASKTVSLTELDDVNLNGLTQTNGKYDLGSGGGGTTLANTGLPKVSAGNAQLGIPGSVFSGTITGAISSINQMVYTPMWCPFAVTLTELAFEVTTGPASDALFRVGIYEVDDNCQPVGAPVIDIETSVATGFTGVKNTSISSVSLPVGMYVIATNTNVIFSTRILLSPTPFIQESFSGSPFVQRMTVTSTYGAMPTPGPAFTAITNAGTVVNHRVLFRWTS